MDKLIKTVEAALKPGWSWLLRSNVDASQEPGQAYFANLVHPELCYRDREKYTNYAYGPTPEAALQSALDAYLFQQEQA